MNRRWWLPFLALVVSAAPVEAQNDAVVEGFVRGGFEGALRPLAYAVVEARGPGVRRSVLADSTGYYRLTGLPQGAVHLRASFAGHASVEIEVVVPGTGSVPVDIELRAEPVELPAVDVTTAVGIRDPDPRDPRAAPGDLDRVDQAAIEIGTGLVDAGLAEAVRAFAGNDPADATDVLFMRGATTDLKLVLLDGAPVYTPFHVAGLLRSFEPAVLGRADLHVGGAPARYDGGLTYILDLRTRRPRRDGPHLSGSLDLLSGSLALDSPLGDQAGIVGSARSLHNLGEAPLGASPYGYRDFLLSLETEPTPGQLVRATGFWNREAVALDFRDPLSSVAANEDDEAWWSNRALSTTYLGTIGPLFAEATLAASGYEATLPLQQRTGEGTETIPLLAEAATDRVRAVFEVAHPIGSGMVRGGLSAESLDAEYLARPLQTGEPSTKTAASSTTVGGYVDVSRSLGADVTFRGGARADHFSGDGSPRMALRASVAWAVGPSAILTVATGRYHQHARANDVSLERSLSEVVADSTTTSADLLPVATADHVIVSLDQHLGETVQLGLTGFWKGFSGLSADESEPVRSSGIDLRVQRRGEASTAWLGYGLNWYWSGANLNGNTSDFTGRQLLTAGISGSLGEALGGEVQIAYGAGLPYTSVPFRTSAAMESLDASEGVIQQAPPLPGGLDEDFLRVDVEVHGIFRPRWGGREWEVRPYLRVLNALDRRDALFYAFEPWRSDEVTPLAERPLVPVVGVSWRF